MIIFLSGEGATDLGLCDPPTNWCSGTFFKPGPMAILIDQIIEDLFHYSPASCSCVYYIPRSYLSLLKERKPSKPTTLSSPTKPRGTGYFRANAQLFAKAVLTLLKTTPHLVGIGEKDYIAVLYRDNDGSHSTPKTLWEDKNESIYTGFGLEGFSRGIAMIPKPIGEAWLICGIKRLNPIDALALESRPSNPTSLHPLKDELQNLLKNDFGQTQTINRETVSDLVQNKLIHYTNIQSPSFLFFFKKIKELLGHSPSTN